MRKLKLYCVNTFLRGECKTSEEDVVEEPQEEEPQTEPEPQPEEETTPEENLEGKLLKLYESLPTGAVKMQYLIEQTGATENEIALAWHRLFDQQRIPLPQLFKP